MRRNKRKTLVGVLLAILFTITTSMVPMITTILKNEAVPTNKHIKPSGYWTASPIVIDEHGLNNWMTLADDELWCTGDGTLSNPFLIENITIDGGGTDSCILIYNSRVHFIIRNCTLFNSSLGSAPDYHAGIKLVNVSNGQIIDNNCSYNQGSGIFLSNNSHNNFISGNNASNNGAEGILLYESCVNNTISGNQVIHNNGRGIEILKACNDNVISGNTLSNINLGPQWYGIYILNSNNNSVNGNNIDKQTMDGIFLGNSNDTRVLGNNISHGNYYHGIRLSACYNNVVSGNNASNNKQWGILLSACHDIVVSENTINNNVMGINVQSDSTDNIISGNTVSNNSAHGIAIMSICSDNTVIGNNVSNNQNNGIYLYKCYNNTISGNNASNINSSEQDRGIYLDECYENVISGNSIKNNTQEGIYSDNGNQNTISDNIVRFNSGHGIFLENESNNNTISNNNVSNNFNRGIFLWNCKNNTISENKISNSTSYGIYLLINCTNNRISENIIKYNQEHGICITGICDNNTIVGNALVANQDRGVHLDGASSNNTVWLNSFIDNIVNNSYDNGGNNKWDNGSHGNYWSDYPGPFNEQGIGTTSYNISGPAGSQDNYPLNDSIPIVSFTATQFEIIATQSVQFIFTGRGGNLAFEYEWNFGDGSPSSYHKNPIHRYDGSGVFNVSLTVADATGDIVFNTSYDFITVLPNLIPVADFSVNATSILEGESIKFTFNGTGGNSPFVIEWYFGDETPVSNETSPVHMYDTAGEYVVILTIIDANGDTSIKTTYISVTEDEVPATEPFPVEIVFVIFLVVGIITLVGTLVAIKKKKGGAITSSIAQYPLDGKRLSKYKGKVQKAGASPLDPRSSSFLLKGSVSSEASAVETLKHKEELAKTESELDINEQEFLCVVHKGPVKGANIYLCPHCKAFYCRECIKVLKAKGEKCWACNHDFEL
ncbi:MAG: NosD domain-containing protein [Promethearchaeota archaeon]